MPVHSNTAPASPAGPSAGNTGLNAGVLARLLGAMIFWGGTWVAAKWAVREAPPFFTAAVRFTIATAILFLIVSRWGRREDGRFPAPRDRRETLRLAGLGLTGVFLYNAVFFSGLKFTTAVNGALIVAANPVFTASLSALWNHERFGRLQAGGFALSMAGVAAVVTGGSWHALTRLRLNTGDLLLLAAPVLWALYSVLGQRAMRTFSPLAATSWAALFGTVLLVPAAVVERLLGAPSPHLTAGWWLAVLQLALMGTVAAFVWWYQAIRAIGAGRSAVFVNLVPLFAVLLAWLILGEQPSPAQLSGGALVILGVWMVQRGAGRAGG